MSDIGGLKPGTILGAEAKPSFAVLPGPSLPKAHNTRFCTCSLCASMWNVVRVKCLLCGAMDGISFRSVEKQSDAVKAETCDKCRGYVKILYQGERPGARAVRRRCGDTRARHAACAGWVETRRTQSVPARLLRRSSERLS